MPVAKLILASASPRRRELLAQIGLSPEISPAEIEELQFAGEAPERFVRRMAELKARWVIERQTVATPDALVLAADTAVVIDDRVLGKPQDAKDARSMLRMLRGRSHRVLTGVCLARTDNDRRVVEVERTHVQFKPYDTVMIDAYVDSGEPMDKAGAYAIQGRGALLVAGISGSWSNVVGLPIERLPEWMERLGLQFWHLANWDRD